MHATYLSHEVLNWHPEAQGSSVEDEHQWKRPYEIWSHAEAVLANATTEFLRVDVITTLKRAIDHRVRLLNDLYSFKSIPIREKPTETLNLLEFLGIVRPLMLRRLLDIRNAVEHEDASPPSHDDCSTFLEFTWYFLKSTDRLSQSVLIDFNLRPPQDEDYYWLNVTLGPEENWIPKIWGWITPDMISQLPSDHGLVVNIESTETRTELAARLKGSSGAVKRNETGRGKHPDDICIRGEVRGNADALLELVKMYFIVT